MIFSKQDILPVAEATGFKADAVEKVCFLLNLLNMLNAHPFLKNKFALKGGTALNLFFFEMPRLSVDIDLNYIGEVDRTKMLEERPKIDKALQAIFLREGFSVKRMPDEHAGGKWRLGYQSYTGQPGNLEVDLNFMFRQPLLPVKHLDSYTLGDFQAKAIPVVDIHELAAGKLAALFSRHQARDLFDAHKLFTEERLDLPTLRTIFVVYGAFNRKDWRTISIEDISFDKKELEEMLYPLLRRNFISKATEIMPFAQKLIDESRNKISAVFPFTECEMDFLNAVLERGEVKPELITSDLDLQKRISNHPMLQWKAVNKCPKTF